jgi:hypothetical protein
MYIFLLLLYVSIPNTEKYGYWQTPVRKHEVVLLCSLFWTVKYKKFWDELIAYFPWYDMGHIENDASSNSSIVVCVFVTMVMFLLSRCLAIIRGFLPSRCLAIIRGFFTELLPSNDKGTFSEPLPINERGGGGTDTHKQRQQRDLISLLLFFS